AMHASQSTGEATWSTISSRYRAPEPTTSPPAFEISGTDGSWGDRLGAKAASSSRAPAVYGVWDAPATWGGTTRAFAAPAPPRAAICAAEPAATTCAAELMLAACRP